MIFVISSIKASGSSSNAWASESGLSSTMAMSISLPSFFWTAVIPNSCGMFLTVMQWISHCVQWQIDSVGVFVWAPAPFCGFCFVSAVGFAVSAGETQVWLGDLRVVVFGLVVVFCFC